MAFDMLGTPILRGRGLDSRDRVGAAADGLTRPRGAWLPQQTVVSRELERRVFAGDALGQQFALGTGDPMLFNVVGVVPDLRWRKHDDDDLAAFYLLGEAYRSLNTLFVRLSGDAASLTAIRSALRDHDPTMVVTGTAMMDHLVARSVADERFRAMLASVFGGAALVLAVVGLYGLAARRVAERRREIGVRVALGARPADVRILVFRDALRTVALGLAAGLPAAFAASQVTQSFLYGVTPTAPHVFVTAAAVLAIAAVCATLLPARRAAAIDPIVVLKD